MEKDYSARLLGAFRRTEEWNLSCTGTKHFPLLDAESVLVPPAIQRAQCLALSRAHPSGVEDRIADCAGVHHAALIMITHEKWPAVPVLTIGDVRVNGRHRYRLTEKRMKELLAAGEGDGGGADLDLHVWLTFPDMTIFDLVLRASLEANAGRPYDPNREDGYTVFGESDALAPELTYEPLLLGEQVLYRIGAIFEEHQEMLHRLRDVNT